MAVKCILTGQTPSVLDGVTENVQTQIDAKAADNAVVHLAENETISGAKTFTGKVVMNSNDNVGIGTTTPSEKLEVNGTVKATKFKGNGSELTNIPYPVTKVAGKTGAVTLAKGDVGLGNVDNTSDANKPISNATQAALNNKQSKITANGILKGDGTGNITAADETEVSLVSLTVDMVDGAVGFTEDIQQTVATTINADTLGGNPPAYYATKASVDMLTTTVNANQTAVETVQSDIQGKLDKTGGTMVGKLIAQSNTDYAVAQVRNIFISTGDPIGGNNGDIWLKYEV